MIKSFGDSRTERLFNDEHVREFEGIARPAKRKLEALNAAAHLQDMAIPPANRLKKLRGKLREYHSIRVNDQWRVIFKWIGNNAHDVSVVDYH
jgi:proteic killer suppression protein